MINLIFEPGNRKKVSMIFEEGATGAVLINGRCAWHTSDYGLRLPWQQAVSERLCNKHGKSGKQGAGVVMQTGTGWCRRDIGLCHGSLSGKTTA
jgi:hypothetical protein